MHYDVANRTHVFLVEYLQNSDLMALRNASHGQVSYVAKLYQSNRLIEVFLMTHHQYQSHVDNQSTDPTALRLSL